MDSRINVYPLTRALKSLTVLCLLLFTELAQAAGVIDTVNIDDRDNPATIRIDFTVPLQYINHAPERQGDELNIQFRPVANNLFSLESSASDQQTVTAAKSRYVPLIDTRYQSIGVERGVMTLRFSRQVDYEIYPGADRRHILIKVVTENNPLENQGSIFAPPRKTAAPDTTGRKKAPAYNLTQHYVISLESFLEGKDMPALKEIPDREKYIVYTTKFPIDGRIWNRLRIGFFSTRMEAEAVKARIVAQYPGAWVAYASAEEISSALEQSDILAAPVTTLPRKPAPGLPRADEDKLYKLMEEARTAIAKNENSRAIRLYTKVRQYPENPYSQDALEFLGLARERNQQYAHAINEYKRYLELYPDGEGADSVRQRLAGLTTASRTPRQLSTSRSVTSDSKPWEFYGGFSQFYRRDEIRTEVDGSNVTRSALSSDLDLTARKRSDNYDLQSRFTGSYLYDFLGDGTGNSSSVSSLYFDANQKQYGLSARLGRQSRNTGGVLGRFDGLLAGYQATDWMTVNLVAGFPVFSTRDSVKTDRYLYGLSADLGTFANAWDFNAFIIEQQNDGILDRRAVGGEARYFDPVRSLLAFVDYDISYDALNTMVLLGTWTLPERTTINASVDYRKSPVLTTTNALQGQTVPDLDELLNSLSEDEIRQLAEDRTADVTTLTLGASHPFSDRFQISGDVTTSRVSGTNSSGGVEGIPGTGNEYFYNLQFIGSSLIKSGDISVLGLRYSDTSNSNISSVNMDIRYPVMTVWRINPRLRVDYRENNNDSTQWIGAPSLRIDYRWRKRYRFELEGGGEWSSQELATDTEDTSSYFVSVGYRADF
jgi:tetratricopeptide (TPR) repeat protein